MSYAFGFFSDETQSTDMMRQDRCPSLTRQRLRSSIDSLQGRVDPQGYVELHNNIPEMLSSSRRGSRGQDQKLKGEIQQYAEKKRVLVANNASKFTAETLTSGVQCKSSMGTLSEVKLFQLICSLISSNCAN